MWYINAWLCNKVIIIRCNESKIKGMCNEPTGIFIVGGNRIHASM